MSEPTWLVVGRELKAIAQIGLTFSQDAFDRQRYERIRELSAALIAKGSDGDAAKVLELFQREAGYATPKVDVRGAVFREGRVLMVREVSDGGWTLPGGWADAEESGFQARATKLAAVHDYRKRNRLRPIDSIYKMFFICELVGGSARPSHETSDVGFFSRSELPTLSAGRTTAEQIELMFRHAERPDLPTEFD